MQPSEEADREQVLLLERLLARVVRNESDGCWIWTGAHTAGGYGALWLDGEARYVHRLVAALFLPWDEMSGKYVLHMCDRPSCCNPNHLRVGSHQENMADASAKGRLSKKLQAADVIEIRRLRAAGHTQQDLAERFGVSRTTVQQIERRETWRHLPDEMEETPKLSCSPLDSLAESA